MQFSNHWVTQESLRTYALVNGIKQSVMALRQVRTFSLSRSETRNFSVQALDFILPSLRHQERRLTCDISEESKWVQKTKVPKKIWTDFGPNYYVAYLTDPDGWQIEAVFKTIQ